MTKLQMVLLAGSLTLNVYCIIKLKYYFLNIIKGTFKKHQRFEDIDQEYEDYFNDED